MDSITQAALGAAIGEAFLGRKIGNKGAIIGAIVATLPDLDVLILPFLDPLERLSMHRGYSHSILFSFLGAILLVFIFRRMKTTKSISAIRLYVFSWLALFTHMFLDAFTPYGTLLLLPFSDKRIGFDSINIVDPFYTIPLLIGLGISLFLKRKNLLKKYSNMGGIIVSTSYLLISLCIKKNVESKFQSTFAESEISVTKTLTEPVGIGSMHWFGLGGTTDGFYIGDYSYLKNDSIHLTYFPANDSLLRKVDSHTADIMKWFAKDFYHIVTQGDSLIFYNMQVDMQGIQKLKTRKAPTKGYFIIENKNEGKLISSGRHK